MPKNAKTLLTAMMDEMSKGFKISKEQLRNYIDPSIPPNTSWVVSYGDGVIVFQYIAKYNINVAFLNFNNQKHPFEVFDFYEDELSKINNHLIAIRQYMEDLTFDGCPHDQLLEAVTKYAGKQT